MAKQATGIFDYVSPSGRTFFNKGRQYTSPTPERSRKTIDPSFFAGKTAAAGAPLASRQVAAAIQEAGPEAMSITDNIAATQPQMVTETQQPIENRGFDPRYMIQGGGPKIDLSGFFPERANKSYDPSKAIGGENVPYQASGFFRGLMGDPANRKNIEAQLAQAAEWRQDAKEQKAEDRLLNRIREGDKPIAERFTKQLAENKAIRDEESATRLRERGEDMTTRKGEREQDRADRLSQSAADQNRWRQERLDKVTQLQEENALRSKPRFGAISTGKGGAIMFNESEGTPVGTYSPGELGEITDPTTGKKSYGLVGGGWNPYTPPVTVPKDLPDSPQVDRGNGLVPGSDATKTTTVNTVPLEPENQNTAIIPRFMQGAGNVLGGAMTYATDPLRYAGTDIYKKLFSSGTEQDPEVLKRLKKREEESSPWDIQ